MCKGYSIAISFILLFVSAVSVSNGQHSIEIHDNQNDCVNSMEYTITDSTIYIDNYAEEGAMYDSNYTPQVFLDKKLSKKQRIALESFMKNFPLDSIRSNYIHKSSKPCDSVREIYIEINWNDKSKTIQIVDRYSKKMASLFNMINQLIPEAITKDALYNPNLIRFDYKPEYFKKN